jgi:hypothetical protein
MTFDEWLDQGHRCGCNENMRKAWNAALESRVLAERKPIYQIQSGYGWIDISEKEFNDLGNYGGKRALFTHPTPDDAFIRGLKVAREFALYEAAHGPNGHTLYSIDAAIDRARQSGEEGNE